MPRSRDEELERQARQAGVTATAFGRDVLEGREERIGSLENGPRRKIVVVDGFKGQAFADAVRTPAPPSGIELASEQRLTAVAPETVDHMAPRDTLARRITDPRQLHEAADLAEQGTPLPGTLAYAKLATAEGEGDFALASQIRARVKQMAPMLRDAAIAAEQAASDVTEGTVRDARSNLDRVEAAKQKRARKAERRRREAER